MQSVLSCLVTDVIGPASLADDLVAVACGEYGTEGGVALREYVRAVELTAAALELEPGDRVVLSPLAPYAYVIALERFGVQIVFPDVNEADACLNPESVARVAAGEPVKALFVHAPLGRVPRLAELAELGVPLVADVGESLGAVDAEGPLGRGADFILLPMEEGGIVTAGGGTLVLAGNRSRLSLLMEKAQGLTDDAFLPDLNASLGLVQWREFPQALETRDSIAAVFQDAVRKGRHQVLAEPDNDEVRAVPYSCPVVVSSGMKDVRRYALKKGIETAPAFSSRVFEAFPGSEDRCPAARALMMSVLLFPLYPTLGKKNVQHIARVLSTLP